jgi:hypothetical protein
MAWTSGGKKRNIKRMRKLKWEESGLGKPAAKERPLIEEIRRQGMMLASRGTGQAVRNPGGPATNADRPASITHRRRRGASG